jgi:archaellum component FlaG (FlaF/FlaG flagellin family)
MDEGTMWSTGDVLVIKTITDPKPLVSGDHRISVVAENGKSDSMSFKT